MAQKLREKEKELIMETINKNDPHFSTVPELDSQSKSKRNLLIVGVILGGLTFMLTRHLEVRRHPLRKSYGVSIRQSVTAGQGRG